MYILKYKYNIPDAEKTCVIAKCVITTISTLTIIMTTTSALAINITNYTYTYIYN